MCSSKKYPYSPHRRDWNFLGGGGFFETKKIKVNVWSLRNVFK